MREIVHFRDELVPRRGEVLARLGIPDSPRARDRALALADEAIGVCERLARPRGLFESLPLPELPALWHAGGRSAGDGPLLQAATDADAAAVFAGTLGPGVTGGIDGLLTAGDVALAVALDAAASVVADRLAEALADRFLERLGEERALRPDVRAIPYSPGYCGWHVVAQEALFVHLKPGEIGIRLTSGSVMDPVKSVSGVLLAAPRLSHIFRPEFEACSGCRRHECAPRLAALRHA